MDADSSQIEQTLRDSEDFKEAVLDSVAAEVAVIDRHGVILAVNAGWRQFSCGNSLVPGQPAASTGVGSNYLAVCAVGAATDQSSDEARQGIINVLEGRLPRFSIEYPCHSPQEKRWFNMVVMPLRFQGQDGATITHTDITPVKLVQEDLRHSFAAIQSILDTTLDGFWRTDLQGHLLEVNPSYCQMSGYTQDELLGLHISDLEELEDAHDTAKRIARLIQHGHDQFESRHRRKDGTVWPVEISTTYNARLSPPCCFVFIRDISERVRLQAEILQGERQRFMQLDKLTASVPGVVYQLRVGADGALSFVYLSSGVESLLEWTADNFYRDVTMVEQCIVEEDRAAYRLSVEQAIQALKPWSHEYRNHTRSGRLKWVHGQAQPEPQADGSVMWFGILTDITAAREAHDQVRQREAYLQAIFETTLDAVIGMDECGRVTHWNQRAEGIFGWGKDEVMGQPLHNIIAPMQSRVAFQRGMAHFLATGQSAILNRRIEVMALRRSGEEFPVELSILPFKDDKTCWFTAFVADISERKRLEQEVRQMAYFDPLTQLPNRRMLTDRLVQALALSKRSGQCAAVMVLDLDNFKPLNDLHGHLVGDLLLQQVASRLLGCVREVDTVARFGGDEFVVVLNGLDADQAASTVQAQAVAEKIRCALAAPYVLSVFKEGQLSANVEHNCSSSIGLALFDAEEADTSGVLKRADAAMYQAKAAGRNQVWLHTLSPPT